MKTVYSSCRICTNCGFEFKVEDNQILDFAPDVAHPYTRGYCCPKGLSAIEFQQGKDGNRLLTSLKRQGDGSFCQIDTLTAANECGEKLKSIIDQHGPRAVALYFGTGGWANTLGNALSRAWIDAIDSPSFFTTLTVDQSCHIVTAGRMGVFAGGMPNVEDIDVALLAGVNPLVSHTGWPAVPMYSMNPGENFKRIRDLGQKLIVVDPRKTETAERATLHLQIIPGEDATLYAGIIRLLFENGWVNEEFCGRFATHVDQLRKSVASYTEDYVANRVGVPVEQVVEAARLLGTAKRPHCACSTGTSMVPDSNLADFLLVAINVLRGGYRRAGDVVTNQSLLTGVSPPMEMVYPPNRTWETGPKCRTQNIGHIFGEFPSALLPDEILAPGEDRIRALVAFGSNPALSFVDPEKSLEALSSLDLLVTIDHRMTDTAELSDYVLATATMHERHDLTSIYEMYYPDNYVQYFQPVVEKPKGVAHDWEVFWCMARAMGAQLELKHMTLGNTFENTPSAGNIDMNEMPKSEDLIRALCEHKGLDFEAIKSAPRGITPDVPEMRVMEPAEDNGARLDMCPDDVADEISRLRESAEVNARYRLAVRRIVPVMNSSWREAKITRAKFPENFAYMNPDDMVEDGISEGSRIRISTATGAIVGTVRGDGTVRRGVVSMTHCFGSPHKDKDSIDGRGSTTGRLIPLDPERAEHINFMTHNTGIPIDVSTL